MRLGEKCLVVGSGISGIGAAELLERMGAKVTLYDSDEKLTTAKMREKLPKGSKARCVAGKLPLEIIEETETVVLSPGVPTDLAFVRELREKGARITGEIELAGSLDKGRIAAVTGTNGKTTTTTLLGEMMKAHLGEERVFVAGNIGNPYTLECEKTGPDTVTVAELSSFQLETVSRFHPAVSAILNITPDHLDRHHTMEAYAAAKERIAANQTKEDLCVLNYENEYTRAFGERCAARVVYFSSARELKEGYFRKGSQVVKRLGGEERVLLDVRRDMRLAGNCNVENVMAAVAMAEGLGAPIETILRVIKDFRPVAHRIEFVARKNGVDYYDDSKGTNPDAAIQGILAMDRPTVLIGGGYDKESSYDAWVESFAGKVKWLVLIGQTREKIAACARAHGFHQIRFADSYEECLALCTRLAEPGEAVLLSPACASWGMFQNYEERGDLFKAYVRGLTEE